MTARAAGARIGSGVVRGRRYSLLAERPAVVAPLTFAVGELVSAEVAHWEKGGATLLDLTARSHTSLPAIVLESLGDALVRVFKFDNSTKTWTFYDPRDEFAGVNTLSGLTSGEVYWIRVTETTTVSVKGRPMTLTCAGDYCWNQIVW